MKKIWFIAWRNVWRNKSRSLVVIIAVMLGTVAGVFVAGLMKGWSDQRVRSCIYTEVSHLKIQNPDYLLNEDINDVIDNVSVIEDSLSKIPQIKAWSPRIKVGAVVSTSYANIGLILTGIDTAMNAKVSDIQKYIIPGAGNFLKSGSRIPPIVISEKTAESLKIKNYKITDQLLDTLKNEMSDSLVVKLKKLSNVRIISKIKLESELKKILNNEDYEQYSDMIIRKAAYYLMNSKVVASFSLSNGQLGYCAFQVVGIFHTTNQMFDQQNCFVFKDDLAKAAGLSPQQVHEIAVIVDDQNNNLVQTEQRLKAAFPKESVLNWRKLSPDAGLVDDFLTVYYIGIMVIIYLALAFGIINTMMMAVLERMKELGMLMAIGMRKRWVFLMIMLETIFLTFIGAIIGMVAGYLLIVWTGRTGLNFSSVAEGYEAIGWASVVYPSITFHFFIQIVVLVVIVAILSSIMPARKVLKIPVIEILKTE